MTRVIAAALDGLPYHVPTLMREVQKMVTRARAERRPRTTAGPGAF